MRALVTGAAGFIGSTLAETLAAMGHDVVGVDAFTDFYDIRLKRSNAASAARAGVTLVEHDLIDADLEDLLDGVDVIFHLAAQPGVRSSWGPGFATYSERNIEVTQRLVDAASRATRLSRFVYSSSSSVYGDNPEFPTSESVLTRPFSPYGVTKLAGEHIVSLFRENFGVPAVSLRYFTVFGPRQRPDMAFMRFLGAARAGMSISVNGDGHQRRDFTYVEDVVRANLAAGMAAELPPSVMNISGGAFASINEVIETIRSVTGSPVTVDYGPRADGDVRETRADTRLARREIGWEPSVGLREGIEAQWRWLVARDVS